MHSRRIQVQVLAGFLLLLVGCSTVRKTDRALYVTLSAADAIVTTYAIDRGYRELNPLLTLGGDGAAEVFVSSVVVSSLAYLMLDKIASGNSKRDHRAWSTVNLMRAFAVSWNLTQLAEP